MDLTLFLFRKALITPCPKHAHFKVSLKQYHFQKCDKLAWKHSFPWILNFSGKCQPTQLHSRGSTEFTNQHFRQIGQGLTSYDRTYKQTNN